jgi:hypothetical protein
MPSNDPPARRAEAPLRAYPEGRISMRAIALVLALLPLQAFAAAAIDTGACDARRAELTQKTAAFTGDAMMKRLIQADLRRASREAAEGDADECMEALDHAAQLLAEGH